MEIGMISSFVSVFISLGIVLVTYVKTWVSLDSSIKNLSKVVDRLQILLDSMTEQQMKVVQDVSVLHTKVANVEGRVHKVEQTIEKALEKYHSQ